MQISSGKKKATKFLKKWIWEGLGLHLGRGWGSFWEGFGGFGALLGSFFGVVFSCLHLGWSSKGVLEASGLDFGSILEGLEGILGGFGMGFGSPWLSLALLGLPWLSSARMVSGRFF